MLPDELLDVELLRLTVPLLLFVELLRLTVPLLLLEVDLFLLTALLLLLLPELLLFTVPLLLLLPELLLFTVPRFVLLLSVDLLRTVEDDVPLVRLTVPLVDSTCLAWLPDRTSERVRAALFLTVASDRVALFTASLLEREERALFLGP